jgi:hypothetical protein
VVFDDGKAVRCPYNYAFKDTIDNVPLTVNAPLLITNVPNDLAVTDLTGREVHVDHADANMLVRKGTMHKINSILTYWE